jgi:subtilisin family serine protease
MKPDIVSLGGYAAVIGTSGSIEYRSGTSYASPIICGLAACLWQAYPKLTNRELIDIIKKSANRYSNPVLPYGYGIPDMEIAMQLAKLVSDSK